ncbi:MAG: hypothetical protein M0P01_08510 [Treponema sp.]|nr:hypothetical protein [Treponema sp.]
MKEMKRIECPLCGTVMEKKIQSHTVTIGLGEDVVSLESYECPVCHFEQGDNSANDKIMRSGIDAASQKCAAEILQKFKSEKISFSKIERKFLLPYRTISKWYNRETKPSAAAVALLRIINAFPWMEKAAEAGFETAEAATEARIYYYTEFNNNDREINYAENREGYIITANIKKGQEPSEEMSVSSDKRPVFIGNNRKSEYRFNYNLGKCNAL